MMAKESERKKNLYSSTDETQSAFCNESSSDNEVAAPIKFPAIHNHTDIFSLIYFLENIHQKYLVIIK